MYPPAALDACNTAEERDTLRAHAELHTAQDAAAAGQLELDDLNQGILEACEQQAPWRELFARYVEESLLFERQAGLMATVAEKALALANIEEGR